MKILIEASDLVSIMIIAAFCFWVWQKHRASQEMLRATRDGSHVLSHTGLLVGSYGNRN